MSEFLNMSKLQLKILTVITVFFFSLLFSLCIISFISIFDLITCLFNFFVLYD